MSGSRPEAEVVTASAGTGAARLPPSSATSLATRSDSALLVGPMFDAPELSAAYGVGTVWVASFGSGSVVADGRGWK